MMYGSLTEFMRNLSTDHSVWWALLVVAAVACASLILFCTWEAVLRAPFRQKTAKRDDGTPTP